MNQPQPGLVQTVIMGAIPYRERMGVANKGSDVLCFIGENPGFEKSKPGSFF